MPSAVSSAAETIAMTRSLRTVRVAFEFHHGVLVLSKRAKHQHRFFKRTDFQKQVWHPKCQRENNCRPQGHGTFKKCSQGLFQVKHMLSEADTWTTGRKLREQKTRDQREHRDGSDNNKQTLPELALQTITMASRDRADCANFSGDSHWRCPTQNIHDKRSLLCVPVSMPNLASVLGCPMFTPSRGGSLRSLFAPSLTGRWTDASASV